MEYTNRVYNCLNCIHLDDPYISCKECLIGREIQEKNNAKYIHQPTPGYSYWDS